MRRAELFKDRSLSGVDKRMLMRFLQVLCCVCFSGYMFVGRVV